MPAASDRHRIACSLGRRLAQRGVTLPGLAERAGVTVVNLPAASNGRTEAVRLATLTAICAAPDCSPGGILTVLPDCFRWAGRGCGGRPRPAVRPGGTPSSSRLSCSFSAARARPETL
ncbi:helix-turn-helix domain-containing protein [Streptomyces sp. NBC_00885]|uniref:helix-turn-helix domain-containing protein n=1 Tax=Streptomyces sp. NBC_00885 TaxID=2975857 RepID=UPI0038638D98